MKVFVVGCYGRGLWLAQNIAKKNISVAYYDVSDQMGHWSPDDWEGPFGFFRHEAATEDLVSYWSSWEPPEDIPLGCSVLFNDLPFNAKSQIAQHALEQFPEKKVSLNCMAQSLASIEISENSKPKSSFVSEFHWGAPFSYRRRTRLGLQRGFEQASESGVEVLNQAKLIDVSLASKARLGSFEIHRERSEAISLKPEDQLVWCLSAEETQFLIPESYKKIFKDEISQPLWFWARFRLRLEFNSSWVSSLPPYFFMTDDLDSLWVRENLIVFRQASSADQWDCWVRLPVAQRFNSHYLKVQSERLESRIKERLKNVQAQVIEWPQESRYTWHEVGPPTHPVWSQAPRSFENQFVNVHFCGIESCGAHDFEARALREVAISKEVSKRHEMYLAKLMREKKI